MAEVLVARFVEARAVLGLLAHLVIGLQWAHDLGLIFIGGLRGFGVVNRGVCLDKVALLLLIHVTQVLGGFVLRRRQLQHTRLLPKVVVKLLFFDVLAFINRFHLKNKLILIK